MKANPESIRCGQKNDSYEYLKMLCEVEAGHLCSTLNLTQGEILEIPFWTSDFPELICIGKFSTSSDGSITYVLDFSNGTI